MRKRAASGWAGLIAVAGPLLAELEERRVAYPVLRELTERTGETCALMVWNGAESMCVEQIAGHHQIKHTTPLGARYTDAMSASVQVFLSAEPVERVRTLLRGGAISYPGLDDAGLDGYQIKLKDVTARGWAINYGESSIDEVGVAAPVYDHRGDIVAAVLISAPAVPRLTGSAAEPGRGVLRCRAPETTRLGRTSAGKPGKRRPRLGSDEGGRGGWPSAGPPAGPCPAGHPRRARKSAAAAGASTAVPDAAPWLPGRCCNRNPATWPACRAAGNCVAHHDPGAPPAAGERSSAVDTGSRDRTARRSTANASRR